MFENSRWIVDMNPLCTHVTAKSKIQEFATGPTCHVFDVSKCHTADATLLNLFCCLIEKVTQFSIFQACGH